MGRFDAEPYGEVRKDADGNRGLTTFHSAFADVSTVNFKSLVLIVQSSVELYSNE
jgi:hypothetical protein